HAGHHGHAARHGIYRDAHHLFDFFGREGIDLACAARDYERAERIPRHLVDVRAESIEIERKIATEGCDGEAEDASEAVFERHANSVASVGRRFLGGGIPEDLTSGADGGLLSKEMGELQMLDDFGVFASGDGAEAALSRLAVERVIGD